MATGSWRVDMRLQIAQHIFLRSQRMITGIAVGRGCVPLARERRDLDYVGGILMSYLDDDRVNENMDRKIGEGTCSLRDTERSGRTAILSEETQKS